MKHIALLAAILVFVGAANAEYIVLKERVTGGDLTRPGVTQVTIDDTYLSYQGDPSSGLTARDTNYNNDWAMVIGEEGGWNIGLVGLKNLTDYISLTSDEITNATFRIRQRSPDYAGETFGVYRVTTPWMFNAPGANETAVTAATIIPGAEPWRWGPNGDAPFSTADYTTTDSGYFTIVSTASKTNYDIDITNWVKMWKADPSTNNGLCIIMTNWSSKAPWDGDTTYFSPSETTQALADGSSCGVEFIIWVPESATTALLAIGGIAFLRRGRGGGDRPTEEDRPSRRLCPAARTRAVTGQVLVDEA